MTPDGGENFDHGAGSVLQDWVMELPLRYQGVLCTSIRGCDSVPKEDPSKAFLRALRGFILNTPSPKPSSFINKVLPTELHARGVAMLGNCDHLSHHFIMHIIHAIQILGYKHPDQQASLTCFQLYTKACRGLHLNAETENELRARLCAKEEDFAKGQSHDS